MPALPLKFSDRFHKQVEGIVDFYDRHAGEAVAQSFLEALNIALAAIEENPNLGTSYTPILRTPLLSKILFRKLHLTTYSSFPYTIFYHPQKRQTMVHVIHHQSINHDALLNYAPR